MDRVRRPASGATTPSTARATRRWFSAYRRASEADAAYRIEKLSALARRLRYRPSSAMAGWVLKRGRDLELVQRCFDRAWFAVVEQACIMARRALGYASTTGVESVI